MVNIYDLPGQEEQGPLAMKIHFLYQLVTLIYNMSKMQLLILYSKLLYKMGNSWTYSTICAMSLDQNHTTLKWRFPDLMDIWYT